MFVGRDFELQQLGRLEQLKKAALVVCRGRRRIGKSTLIQQFGSKYGQFSEFQGLAPRTDISNRHQLDHFSNQLADCFGLPRLHLKDWHEAFALLAHQTAKGKHLIFLDEISWMASSDSDFVGQLKIAWDTKFKMNSKLLLVLCGSVSSWIDKNILNGADFVGRISLALNLQELPLHHCHDFWGNRKPRTSALEKFRILALTGGVPRYLEEVDYKASSEQNISDLCFRSSAVLLDEFDKIFSDIFSKRADTYKTIIRTLLHRAASFSEICKEIGISQNGAISSYLDDLVSAGFIRRDWVYSPQTGRKGKLSAYRLSDNYLRFYLQYVEPHRDKIAQGIYDEASASDIIAWDTILGLQFENLVLNNIKSVLNLLKVRPDKLISASPYFQRASARKKACQIDLLIQTKTSIYVCEIKFSKIIGSDVINEVQEKMTRLNYDTAKSLRPVLIFVGKLTTELEATDYFDAMIDFEELLG